jgi:AraC-like DNA-binding protein
MHAAPATLTDRPHAVGRGSHGRLDWLYAQACLQLQRHMADRSYDVTRLVDELKVSRPTLYRAFARHGDTVAGCLRRARLARVCELLAQPPFRTPTETLAYQCGFEDVRTFNRCFRKAYGLSAGAWRANAVARELSPIEVRPSNRTSAAAAASA